MTLTYEPKFEFNYDKPTINYHKWHKVGNTFYNFVPRNRNGR